MCRPDQLRVFSCLPLLMIALRSKKVGQPLGKAGVGLSGLRWPPAKRGCESPVARGEEEERSLGMDTDPR